MKLIHIADIHLGKIVNKYSMIEDQKYVMTDILRIIDDEKPDGIIIAGDIYDRSAPSAEAVSLFNFFLEELVKRELQVFAISGNHDSAERIAFAHKLLDLSGVHLSPVYSGTLTSFILHEGEDDETNVYLLPFIKPANVRAEYPDEEISSYTDAMKVAINNSDIDINKVNILVAHQFVTGAERCESEEISVGGLDNVEASVFDGFDYVALGHLHGPQSVGRETVRYAGSPIKYSFSEINHEKSVTIIEIGGKESIKVRTAPLNHLHDMVEIKGFYNDLMDRSYYSGTTLQSDYVRVILTDENDIPDAVANLRTVYHNLMELKYDNTRTRSNPTLRQLETIEKLTPQDLFSEFYIQQNGVEMSEEQQNAINEFVKDIWEEE